MGDSTLRESLGPLGDGEVLGERVFETISDAIVEGRLAPGQRISDKEIAEALEISRTPVREALRHLSWLGLVEVSPNRFTRVTEVTTESIAHTLEYTNQQAGIVLHLATRRMDAEARQEAVSLLDRMIEASAADDAADLMLSSRMFVGYLTQQSRNPMLVAGMRAVDLLVTRNLRRSRVMLGTPASRAEHLAQIRAAILAGDGDAAEQWFRRLHDQTLSVLPG